MQTTDEATENQVFEEQEVKSWGEFVSRVDRITEGALNPDIYFRGQADASWPLEPSLLRIYHELGFIDAEEVLRVEDSLREQFMKQAHLYVSPRPSMSAPGSLFAWWALMQHYGAPTRLLDWTLSPYVSCYFAVVERQGTDGAVWAFDRSMFEPEPSTRYALLPPKPPTDNEAFHDSSAEWKLSVFSSDEETPRMVAQQSTFTVCRQVLGAHDSIIERDPKGEGKRWKIIISKSRKHEFLARLRAMNITAGSLFPGGDGLGRSIAEYAKVGACLLQRSHSSEERETGAT